MRMTPAEKGVGKAKSSREMIPAEVLKHPGTALPKAICL